MSIVQDFVTEVRSFSKNNWWVYIIYIAMLTIILVTQKSNLPSVVLVSSVHFIADMFIMMMFSAYLRKDDDQGTYFQIISLLLFLFAKVYTGCTEHKWHYLMGDPLYILAAIKNYRLDVKKNDLKIVNAKTMLFVALLIIVSIWQLNDNGYIHIDISVPEMIQTTGIFLFAIALSITDNERLRYEISLAALSIMVSGSAWETLDTIVKGTIVGLSLSYSLLPLTVLVFYVKRWPEIMGNRRLRPIL